MKTPEYGVKMPQGITAAAMHQTPRLPHFSDSLETNSSCIPHFKRYRRAPYSFAVWQTVECFLSYYLAAAVVLLTQNIAPVCYCLMPRKLSNVCQTAQEYGTRRYAWFRHIKILQGFQDNETITNIMEICSNKYPSCSVSRWAPSAAPFIKIWNDFHDWTL